MRVLRKFFKITKLNIILPIILLIYIVIYNSGISFTNYKSLLNKLFDLFGMESSIVSSILDYENAKLSIIMLDVGHGDCLIISAKDDYNNVHSALVDTGSPQYAEGVINSIKNINIGKLDFILVTHPHSDHMGSLSNIVQKIPTKEIFIPNVNGVEEMMMRNQIVNSMVKKKKLKLTPVYFNQKIYLGKANFNVLSPKSINGVPAKMPNDINDTSIVSTLQYKNFKMMLTGDASSNIERSLLKHYSKDELKSSILKVAHHGSRSASSTKFLNAVGPYHALISSGSERGYKYPHAEVSRRLSKSNIIFFNTKIVGTICVLVNDKMYSINYGDSVIEHKYP